ncbi:MAG: porin family protein [Proteobacteria bacterium]|nr:porin family protein [Pseudomonadota bacterium]MBU1709936.1 porin family protein [Pseudomonadota bacterium]
MKNFWAILLLSLLGLMGVSSVWAVEYETMVGYSRGAAFILDQTQTVNDYEREFESSHASTYSVSLEHRFPSSGAYFWGLGADFTSFTYDFKPAEQGAMGTVDSSLLMFNARYYFDFSAKFHPYVSGGFGIGYAGLDDRGDKIDHHGYGGLQCKLGAEYFLGRDFGMFAEGKWLELRGKSQDFDPTSYGIFAGIFFVFR